MGVLGYQGMFVLQLEGESGVVVVAVAVVLGSTLLEGTAVGLAQWAVLRRLVPKLRWQAWWLATAVGAFIAWTLGMVSSTLMSMGEETAAAAPPEISDALMYTLAFGMGLVLGPILALLAPHKSINASTQLPIMIYQLPLSLRQFPQMPIRVSQIG